MKNKMKYFYGVLLIVIIAAVWFSAGNKSKNIVQNKTGTNAQIPEDEIHSKFNSIQQAPSKDNVSKNFLHEMDMMKKHIEEVPSDTASIKKYAELLFSSHKYAEAINFYNRILKIDKKRRDILFDLLFAYYKLKNLSKAEFYSKLILKYYPNNLSGQYNLGAIYASEGKKDSAANIWGKIIINKPNSYEANLAKSSLKRLRN